MEVEVRSGYSIALIRKSVLAEVEAMFDTEDLPQSSNTCGGLYADPEYASFIEALRTLIKDKMGVSNV